MKNNTGLIVGLAVAAVALAAAAACIVVFRDTIFAWLQVTRDKFLKKAPAGVDDFDDFADE